MHFVQITSSLLCIRRVHFKWRHRLHTLQNNLQLGSVGVLFLQTEHRSSIVILMAILGEMQRISSCVCVCVDVILYFMMRG